VRLLGFEHADGNVLFGPGGDTRALYRLQATTYEFLTDRQKYGVVAALAVAVMEAQADGSIWRVCRNYPADHYVRQASRTLDHRYADERLWRWHVGAHERLIRRLNPRDVEVYLAVRLPERNDPAAVLSEARRALWRISRRVESAAGVQSAPPVSREELAGIREQESALFDRLRGPLGEIGIDRARTQEIQWLLARARCRGVGEPELDQFWRPRALAVSSDDGSACYRPLTAVVDRAANARITRHDSYLEVGSEHGSCFQAALVVGALPEAPPWPGPQCELMFAPLERLSFPVDCVLHWRYMSNEKARRQARGRTLDVDNTWREETAGVLGGSYTAGETRELARLLQAYLDREDHPPILTGALQLIVGAGEVSELERRVTQLRDAYRPLSVYRPSGIQRRLYYEHLPRCGSAVSEWDDPLTIEQVGAMVPVATTATGSLQGPYVGYTPITRRLVKFDVTEAARESAGSAVLLAGGLGSGKTVSAQSIATTALLRGSQVVDIDPKPDHGFHKYPPIQGLVHCFELSPDEANRGQLDPMRVPVIQAREEAALSYFAQLVGESTIRQPGARPALTGAIRECMHAGEWGSLAVIARLQAGGTVANALADELASWADFGLTRLAFSEPQDDTVHARGRLTSIRTPALDLPDATQSRETYSDRQRVSVATLGLLADMALRLVSGDPTHNKVILFDEAWFLLASAQGRALFQRLVRMGRAMNAVIMIATQRLADVGDLEHLVGTFLIFGQRTEPEARGALALLGLPDASDRMVARVQGYTHGLCLMRDIRGRLAEVQFDMEPGMLAAFDTSQRPASSNDGIDEPSDSTPVGSGA
jgi:AAA-like domain